MIKENDYIQGYEYYGNNIKIIKGWVDKINKDISGFVYDIQADDGWHGARGTMIFEELGEVVKLENRPRPIKQ